MGKVTLKNIVNFTISSGLTEGGVLGAIAPPSRKSLAFLKEHKNKISLFVLLHLNFCPAIEK